MDAVYKLYPTVVTVRGEQAFDANEQLVDVDWELVAQEKERNSYIRKRSMEYPPITDYLDGVVKGDQAQIDAYIAACQAVKLKYPKP